MPAQRRPQQQNYGENQTCHQVFRRIPVAVGCHGILLLTNRLHPQYKGKNIRNYQLDSYIVWNDHNTVLGSKRLAICATI